MYGVNAAFVGWFLKFIKDRTPKYRKETRYDLSVWTEALHSRDLRKIKPCDVLKFLSPWNTAEQKPIATLRCLSSCTTRTAGEP